MSKRFFSVHGHFYQPPREDPFSGEIPQEYGAQPFPNWNEKIFAECYQPNVELGNFMRLSFDFGPALMKWMENSHPKTYQAIIQQEQLVLKRYGASNAMAHPYHHVIMPLANRRDKITLVKWGIHDYQLRFGHAPQGMWLPETAVDFETLEVLSEEGIDFTILAPWQTYQQPMDISHPYMVKLSNGNSIQVFFSEGYLSHDLSFNPPASEDADRFAKNSLVPAFEFLQRNHRYEDLILVASDGELYGHHQPKREYFLQRLFTFSMQNNNIHFTFPALWLKEHQPKEEIAIHENTSWSCHHGVERWRTVCPDGPNSTWKEPLRDGLDHLAKIIDRVYEDTLGSLVSDPWKIRNKYANVFLGVETFDQFIQRHVSASISEEKKRSIELLLQAQFERMRMFTSDGWFFEELDRIESQNCLKFAALALQRCRRAVDLELESFKKVIDILSRAEDEKTKFNAGIYFRQLLEH